LFIKVSGIYNGISLLLYYTYSYIIISIATLLSVVTVKTGSLPIAVLSYPWYLVSCCHG